jgi:hypothetical protein
MSNIYESINYCTSRKKQTDKPIGIRSYKKKDNKKKKDIKKALRFHQSPFEFFCNDDEQNDSFCIDDDYDDYDDAKSTSSEWTCASLDDPEGQVADVYYGGYCGSSFVKRK